MIRDDLLSGEAVALATKEIGRVLREARKATPSAPVTDQAVAAKDREVEELRNLMRGGVLSPTVGQAALNRAHAGTLRPPFGPRAKGHPLGASRGSPDPGLGAAVSKGD